MDLIEKAAQKALEAKQKKLAEKDASEQGQNAKVKDVKKSSSNLVERAVAAAGTSSFDKVGSYSSNEGKRDPSSMNPSSLDQSVSFAGIGNASNRKARTPSEKTDKVNALQPDLKKDDPSTLAIGQGRDGENEGKARTKREEEIDLQSLREGGYITPEMSPNLMSEEFRIIKRSILLNAFSKGMQKSKNSNVILVTSSNPGEGKTFCTINLALSIATEQDTTVLLIDADFSKPEVLNRLGVSGGRGLMDIVADSDLQVQDCLIRTNVPNLVLLPAGRQHNLTTELLASERMEAIVDEIANRYPDRLVIFDSPPVLASSAASVLALYMGQTVFVIKAEETSEPQIKESLNMISGCPNISLLLNQTKYSGSNKRFATYYGYGGR